MIQDTPEGRTHHDNDACIKCKKCLHHIVEGRMCGCPYALKSEESGEWEKEFEKEIATLHEALDLSFTKLP